MTLDLSIAVAANSPAFHEAVVLDVDALERRGMWLQRWAAAGLVAVGLGAVGTALWWYLGAPSVETVFHSVDLPKSLASLKYSGLGTPEPGQGMIDVIVSWTQNDFVRLFAIINVVYGLTNTLYSSERPAKGTPSLLLGMVLLSAAYCLPFFMEQQYGRSIESSGSKSLSSFVDDKNWPSVQGLLASNHSADAVYVRAQVAYLQNDLHGLQTHLNDLAPVLDHKGLSFDMARLHAMEMAAHGKPVSRIIVDWTRAEIAARASALVAVKSLIALEVFAVAGLNSLIVLALLMRQRAVRLKSLVSEFSPYFSGRADRRPGPI